MASSADALHDLHANLHRRYNHCAAKIDATWRRLSAAEREKTLRAGLADGQILHSREDASLGNLHLIVPEWNLRDLAEGPPENLLYMLHDRATRDLHALYMGSVDGDPRGDGDFIRSMVDNHGLRHKDHFRNCWTFFIDLGNIQPTQGAGGIGRYGSSMRINRDHDDILARLDLLVKSNLIIPQRIGELVITRQTMLAQLLLTLLDDILYTTSPTSHPRPPADRERHRHTSLNVTVPSTPDSSGRQPPPPTTHPNPSLEELIAAVEDRAAACRDYNDLLRTEPEVLSHAINIHFYSRPDLLPDEVGRTIPAHTDKYIPGVFLDVMKGAARDEALWRHLARLLRMLDTEDNTNRATATQHIANIFHSEYTASQVWLGRQLSLSNTLRSAFRRTARPDDAGRYKLVLRKDAGSSENTPARDRHLLRLAKTTIPCRQAGPIIAAIDNIPAAESTEDPDDGITDALSNLAEIVWLVQGLAATSSLPAFTRHRCQEVPLSLAAVDAGLDALRTTFDVTDFIPSANTRLTSAELCGALDRLDAALSRQDDGSGGGGGGGGGGGIAARYNTAIAHALDRVDAAIPPTTPSRELSTPTADTAAAVPRQAPASNRRKQKIRPPPPPGLLPAPARDATTPPTDLPSPTPTHVLHASAETVATMTTILRRSEAPMVLSWNKLESAMADVGFRITPRGGSIFTYTPPAVLAEHGSITLHRPRDAKVEGFRLLYLEHRLRTKYGWTVDSFTPRR